MLKNGLCLGFAPKHRVEQLCRKNELKTLQIKQPLPDSPCCIIWNEEKRSPTLCWLLDYLGNNEAFNAEWLTN